MLQPLTQTRLLPVNPQDAKHNYDCLEACIAMLGAWPEKDANGIMAGYTYWGQFLAHELDPRSSIEPQRTAVLDLDSLYGGGWHDERIKPDPVTGKFLLGATRVTGRGPAWARDLYRNSDGVPVIPERRNDENLLVAQFHLLMQRVHNAIVATLASQSPDCRGEAAFTAARQILTGLFHRLVRRDYLAKVTLPAIHDDIFNQGNTYLQLEPGLPLPLEISQALLRFGHSQVRKEYQLNDDDDERLPLSALFGLTHNGELRGPVSLPDNRVVAWHLFFDLDDDTPHLQGGNKIDPYIVRDMRAQQDPDIIRRNLEAGARASLCCGQALAGAVLKEFPSLAQLGLRNDHGCRDADALARLDAAGVRERTPLWIHILLEADASVAHGSRLGPLGSLLLCEVLRNAMDNTCGYQTEAAAFCAQAGLALETFAELVSFVINLENKEQDV